MIPWSDSISTLVPSKISQNPPYIARQSSDPTYSPTPAFQHLELNIVPTANDDMVFCPGLPAFPEIVPPVNGDEDIKPFLSPKVKKVKKLPPSIQFNPFGPKRSTKVKDSTQYQGEEHCMGWRKDYHNAIEKRRRDKINSLIEDIQNMLLEDEAVPANCDKVTTLSAAIDYLKSNNALSHAQAHTHTHTSASFPSPLTLSSFVKTEFKNLFASHDAGFLLTFRSADYIIIYVSEGVTQVLGLPPSMLFGQAITKFLHPTEGDEFKVEHQQRLLKSYEPCFQNGEATYDNLKFVNNMVGRDPVTGYNLLLPILFTGEFKTFSSQDPSTNTDNVDVLCFSAALKSLLKNPIVF